jgi:hypothetical protein
MAEPAERKAGGFLRFFTTERMNVFLTFIIAATGVVGIILVVQGGKDTARIRDAAEKQAKAARDFADTAASINAGINNAVSQLNIQAGAENTSAKIAQASLQPSVAFGIKTTTVSDNTLSYELHIVNEGGTTARVTMRTCALYDPQLKPDVLVDSCNTSQAATNIRTDGPLNILPHHESIVLGTQPNIEDAKSGKFYLYTPYELSYTYAKIQYVLPHCFVYDKSISGLNECGVAIRNQAVQKK